MNSIKLFNRIHPYINLRWNLTILAYVCLFIQLTLNMVQPLIFGYLIDHVLIEGKAELIFPILGLSLGLSVIAVFFVLGHTALFRYLGIKHTLDIRNVLLAHIRKIPIQEIEKQGPGKFSALLGFDTATLGNFMNHILVELLAKSYMLLLALGILMFVDWKLGLIATLSIPLLLFLPRLVKKPLTHHTAHVRTHNEEIGTYLIECIEGSREIRTLNLEKWEEKRNNGMYKGLVQSSTKETLFRVISQQSSSLVISFFILIVYWQGSKQYFAETLTIGMLVASVTYLTQALMQIQQINNFFGELQRSEVALGRIESFLQSPIEKHFAQQSKGNMTESDSLRVNGPSIIEVNDLHVYSQETKLLEDIHCSITEGQTIALIGRSGAGKTTLLRTIVGFLPEYDGQIFIGNKPLEEMTRKEINQRIGIIFQDSFIFKGTLFENISLGDLSATEEEVYEAACQAKLGEWIDQLPQGLYTMVDNKGANLSGGQRQRMALARMFLKKPDILLLDEPTSALDQLTEKEIMEALGQLMKGKTTLISTHRLQTIINADQIYLLEQGKIIEYGTHDQLLQRSARYSRMLASFSREEEHQSVGGVS